MILVDYRGFVLNEVFGYANFIRTGQFDEKVFIQSIIVTLGEMNKRFRSTYGEIVICNDCKKSEYWRNDIFPNYKANRNKNDIYEKKFPDPNIRSIMRKMPTAIARIIKENVPFKILTVDKAEADDIIAALVYANPTEKHIIISKDQDFLQLQRFNVDQFVWGSKGGFVECDSPTRDLKEKVLRGDRGDGIPNVLSPINCLVEGVKQTSLYKLQREELMEADPKDYDDLIRERFELNERLIDLSKTPVDICQEILNTYAYYDDVPYKALIGNMMKLSFRKVIENLNLYKK